METAPALLTFLGSPQVASRGSPAGTSVSLDINIHAWLTAPPPQPPPLWLLLKRTSLTSVTYSASVGAAPPFID